MIFAGCEQNEKGITMSGVAEVIGQISSLRSRVVKSSPQLRKMADEVSRYHPERITPMDFAAIQGAIVDLATELESAGDQLIATLDSIEELIYALQVYRTRPWWRLW